MRADMVVLLPPVPDHFFASSNVVKISLSISSSRSFPVKDRPLSLCFYLRCSRSSTDLCKTLSVTLIMSQFDILKLHTEQPIL